MRWLAGATAVRAPVERWATGALGPDEKATPIHEHDRRLVVRIDSPALADCGMPALLIKRFRVTRKHWLRDGVKRLLGQSAARREWRSLRRLETRGAAVPAALGLAVLPGGDHLLAVEFVEGTTLERSLPAARAERGALLASVGGEVARLHAAGLVHRDLHSGNILVTDKGPVLIDLQRAWRSRSPRAQLRDLGYLGASLGSVLSTPDRVRLGAAALGLERPFDARARARLKALGRAAGRRVAAREASRTRRSVRTGRRFARLRCGDMRGMRLRSFEEALAIEARREHERALAARDERVLKDDGRSRITAVRVGRHAVVVKQVVRGGPARWLADGFRGSPARRAWLGGHGLIARGVGAATPLAYLERRRAGLPVASLCILQDVRVAAAGPPCQSLSERARRAGAEPGVGDALVRLLVRLHGSRSDHGDLKSSHIFLSREGDAWCARLIDLEGVRFRRQLRDERRVRALAQLNASLPDAFPAHERRRGFDAYARRLPFVGGARRALERVVALSLERRHVWTGAGCDLGSGGERH